MALISEEYEQTGGSRLLPPFTRDLATVTASAEEAGAPASALMNKNRRKTWRGALPDEVSEYDETSGMISASMADGAAFVIPDLGSGADLSPFARTHKILVTDGAGKQAWGYLGAAGSAEYLGSELVTNGDFESDISGWSLTVGAGGGSITWDAGTLKILQGTSTTMFARQDPVATEADKLYRVLLSIVEQTGTYYTKIFVGKSGGPSGYYYESPYGGVRDYSQYICTEGQLRVQMVDDQFSGYLSKWDNISVMEITGPGAAGCWVNKTPGGDNGWAFKQYGFDPNDIASYDVYPALVWLDYNFGQSVDIDALALVNHNLTAEGAILLALGSSQGAEDVGFGSFPAYTPFFGFEDSLSHGYGGFLTPEESARVHYTGKLRLLYLDAAYSGLWLRVGFWDPDNPAGYVEASTIFMGECWKSESQPVVNDGGIMPVDPSILSKAEGGEGHREVRRPYRSATYHWPNTAGSETFALWFDLLRRMGEGVPFIIDLMPATTLVNIDMRLHHQLYAMIPEGGIKTLGLPFLDHGDVKIAFEEVL